jgi:hypothetical protein
MRAFDDRAFFQLSRSWSCGWLLLLLCSQAMVGGYHLIMSVISFVAFQVSSARGCKLWKSFLQSTSRRDERHRISFSLQLIGLPYGSHSNSTNTHGYPQLKNSGDEM